MRTIDDVLGEIPEDTGEMIIEPATDGDIKLCNADFSECGFDYALPGDYADFLKKHDGFAWNGVEFYGTCQVTDMDTDYMLDDIVSANESFRGQKEGSGHFCYLGRADEDLFVYDTRNKLYKVLDFSGLDVMEEYETFAALFESVVWNRI